MALDPQLAQSFFALGTQYNAFEMDPVLPLQDSNPQTWDPEDRDIYKLFLRGYVVGGLSNGSIDIPVEALEALAEKALEKFSTKGLTVVKSKLEK